MAQNMVRRHKGLTAAGVLVVLCIAVWLFWSWDWFLPIVDAKATAIAGRRVTAQHLHVRLWTTTRIELDGIRVEEPKNFVEPKPFATVGRLVVTLRPFAYLHGGAIVVPTILIADADATIRGLADGTSNLDFPFMHPAKTTGAPAKPSPSPKLGELDLANTHVDVNWAKLRAKFGLDLHTEGTGEAARIVVLARGTYAAQSIDGRFRGGAILTLRDRVHPYPLDLYVANGATHVSMDGTVQDPLHFAGANVKLVFAGPDMGLLYPLTGVPIPSTPPYKVSGGLAYTKGRIAFENFSGTLGSSDLGGTITVDPTGTPPDLRADLHSRAVDLADLGGFLGGNPGHPAENKQAHAQTGAKGGTNLLPTTPISLPKLKAMNVDFHYKAGRIEGKSVPLDNLTTWFVIHDGAITVHELNFGVGHGTLASRAYIAPAGKDVKAEATLDVRDVDLSHLLNATHVFHGQGIVGGQAELRGTGASVAELVGNGSGGVALFMRDGGNISALLPDIAGLEFGNALLSALGIPNRTDVQCFAAEMPLHDGVLSANLFVLQTKEARTTGEGTINLRNDTLDWTMTTRSTGFSIGSLPGPIHIRGGITSPSILPGAEVVARGAGAVGLGILFPPLGILPTIQLGVGQSKACQAAIQGSTRIPNAPGGATAAGGSAPVPAPAPARPHLSPAAVHKAWRQRLSHGG